MYDFNPLSIVKNLPKLAKMFESRSKLNDLLAKVEGNDDLERMLMDLMSNKALRDTVKTQLQGGAAAAAPTAPAAAQPTPPDKPAPTTP
jgi:type VI secretion system protein ImpB